MSNIILLASQLAELPAVPPCHIERGILPKQSIVGLAGAPGSAKTFVGLSMGLAMSAGIDWFGRKTECKGVLYVCGEGFAGMPGRILAWCAEHNIAPAKLDKRFGICRVPFDISDEVMRARILAELTTLGIDADVVFLDTLSANAPPGFDENGTAHMKAYMDAARYLRDALPCTAVLVHHMGHGGTRERGSSDFRGAVDVMLFLSINGDERVLTCDKSRDFEPFKPMRFSLAPRHGSAVLVQAESAEAGPLPSHRALLTCLAELENGAAVRCGVWERASGYKHSQFNTLRSEVVAAGYVLSTKAGYLLDRSGRDLVRLSDSSPIAENRTAPTSPIAFPPRRGTRRTSAPAAVSVSDRTPVNVQSDTGPGLLPMDWDSLECEAAI